MALAPTVVSKIPVTF